MIALFLLVEQGGNYLPLLQGNLVLRGRKPTFLGIVEAHKRSVSLSSPATSKRAEKSSERGKLNPFKAFQQQFVQRIVLGVIFL